MDYGISDPPFLLMRYCVSTESAVLANCVTNKGTETYSAAILIWQGSVRTKKTISVEEKLRTALQLPIAIAIPRTEDGTVVTGHNKAPLPSHDNTVNVNRRSTDGDEDDGQTDESGKRDDETLDPLTTTTYPVSPRRTTITIGSTGEKVVDERQRAASITAPGHTPPLLDEFVKLGPPLPQSDSKEEERK